MGIAFNKGRPAVRSLFVLAGFIAVCFAVSAIAGLVTATSVSGWYQTLEKPTFNPPDWVFAPVWTALYLMMAIAGWRVWGHEKAPQRSSALVLFAVQLGLNLIWSVLFFGLQTVGAALIEILILLAAILLTVERFRRIDPLAGMLLAPYALWVAYASLLNFSIWRLN